MKAGANILDTSEPGPDRDNLEQKLNDTTSQFENLKAKTSDRQERLDKVVPLSRKHKYESQTFKPWLVSAEKRVGNLQPLTCDKTVLDKQLKSLEELDHEIEDRKPDLQELNDTAADLVESCQADRFIVEGDTQDVNKRYDALEAAVEDLKKKVQSVKEAVEKYDQNVCPVQNSLDDIEKAIKSHDPVGIDLINGKQDLVDIEKLEEKLNELKPDLMKAKESGLDLVSALDDKSPSGLELKNDIDTMCDRYNDLKDQLAGHKKKVHNEIALADKFHDTLNELQQMLPDIQESIDSQSPISSEPSIVKQQLEQAEVSIFY